MVNSGKFAALLLVILFRGSGSFGEERAVSYAKEVDVSILDSALKPQHFADWLRDAIPDDHSIEWRASNCGLSGKRDDGICVRCDINRGQNVATVIVQVGTRRHGITGTPRVRSLDVPPYATDTARLSELPRFISLATATVDSAKSIDVRTLDPTLPSEPLDEWLRQGPMRLAKVDWQISDCDIKPIGEQHDRHPICAKFLFEESEISGHGVVVMGSIGQGVMPPAKLLHALVARGMGSPGARSDATASLAHLPELLEKYRSLR